MATTFNLTLGPSEQLKSVATQSCSVIANIGRVLHDRSVLYKYLNPHLVAIATTKLEPHPSVSVILLDSVTGNIYFRGVYPGGHGTPKLVLCENSVVVGFKTNPLVEDLDLLVDKPIVPSTNEDKKPTLKNKKSKKSKPKNYKTRVETGSTKGYEVVVLDVFESLTSDERMPMGYVFWSAPTDPNTLCLKKITNLEKTSRVLSLIVLKSLPKASCTRLKSCLWE